MNEKRTRNEKQIVLYRCPTPTNVLCPCGAVARRLGKLRLEPRIQRVPYRRSRRPEIEELTRQKRVPVLVDGDEVIHDSKRIVQYLDWAYGEQKGEQKRGEKAGKESAEKTDQNAGGKAIYNLKRWRHRKRQSS